MLPYDLKIALFFSIIFLLYMLFDTFMDNFVKKNKFISFEDKILKKINDAFFTAFDLVFQIIIVFVLYFYLDKYNVNKINIFNKSFKIFNSEFNTSQISDIIILTFIGMLSRYISSRLVKLIGNFYSIKLPSNYKKINNNNTFFAFFILLLSNFISILLLHLLNNLDKINDLSREVEFLYSILIVLISQILNIQTTLEFLNDFKNFICSNFIILLICLFFETFICFVSNYNIFLIVISGFCLTIASFGYAIYEKYKI